LRIALRMDWENRRGIPCCDDFLMRSDSRFIPNSVLNIEVKTISAIMLLKIK